MTNEILYLFVAMLIVCIAGMVRSTTAKDKLGISALTAFIALMSGIVSSVTVFPEAGKMLVAIANMGAHQEGAMVLMASGSIILVMIMMALLYSEVSTEEEVGALLNKVLNPIRWFSSPPLRDKRTLM